MGFAAAASRAQAESPRRAARRSRASRDSKLFGDNRQLARVFDGLDLIRTGTRGAGLRKVQQALTTLGYGLPKNGADGRWHYEVRDALVALQSANEIDASGIVDQATVKLLDRLLQAKSASGTDLSGGDGSISTADLRAAEKIMGRYALTRALGQDPARIEFDAIDYLQGTIGSMDGQVDRLQKVLVE